MMDHLAIQHHQLIQAARARPYVLQHPPHRRGHVGDIVPLPAVSDVGHAVAHLHMELVPLRNAHLCPYILGALSCRVEKDLLVAAPASMTALQTVRAIDALTCLAAEARGS